MKDLKPGPDLKRAVDSIQALTDQYNALAEKKKYFQANGTWPPVAIAKKPIDKAELIQAINNCRSRLSKARAAVKKDPGNSVKGTKVVKIQAELSELENSIQTL